MRIACIALAGTLGAMGMLGHRRGGAVELLAAGGHLLISRAPPALASLAGIVIHALWMALWAHALVTVARHHRGPRATLEAMGIAAAAFGAAVALPAVVVGPVATLTIGERALVHIVLALSLVIGIRVIPAGDVRAIRRVTTGDEAWLA